jgi:uncharacterized membrane protein YuzA (DUF378 family)
MEVENFGNQHKNKMYSKYLKVKVRMVVTAIVIIGAVNWGTTALGYNLVEILSKTINASLKTDYPIDKIIYIVVALCAVSLAVRRNTWLPFLGRSVLPGNLVTLQTPAKADKKVKVKVNPKAKVAYWAALGKDKKEQDVFDAYGDYTNSGVVVADEKGYAELPIIEGGSYKIPSGKKLPRHIHYRIIGNSMMGCIQTVNY